jgi:hypothetical protein
MTSSVPPTQACEAIRARLRSQFALLKRSFELEHADAMVGRVVARYVFARPVPAEAHAGRFIDSLVVRGRVVATPGGGCEVRITAARARFGRLYLPIILAALATLIVLVAAIEARPEVLIGLIFLLVAFVVNRAVMLVHDGVESSEERLIKHWVAGITHDIAGAQTDPE